MILLDTNVVSALMRSEPDPSAVAWLDAQPAESIWTTSITVFEIRLGLELLVPGRRRKQLTHAFDELLANDLAGRVHAFDQTAALAAGRLAADQQRSGSTLEIRDIQIGGIAVARKATVATRNVRHFEQLPVSVVDPWAA